MPSSDEDFESADEGHSNIEKKERKKRLSSFNYSENALESDQEFKTPLKIQSKTLEVKEAARSTSSKTKEADGWDDFDVDESESIDAQELPKSVAEPNKLGTDNNAKSKATGWDDFSDWGQDDTSNIQKVNKSKNADWDDFSDWGQDGTSNIQKEAPVKTLSAQEYQPPSLPLPQSTPASAGWGWGWSVDSLLSSASAGISSITSQVSQGISTVLETGIGAPDPEELARVSKENQAKRPTPEEPQVEATLDEKNSGDAFQFGSLLSGVTKFVENTGTKVLDASLDTLETIGKKTMEVLQDGDPGLAKKRALLGLDSGDKPILSQVLREAKAKAEEEDQIREVKREAKEIHYETLFDDFEGLVHLEALEMLSRQTSMRMEERIRSADPDKRQDIKETLQQVAELCEIPDEDIDDEETSPSVDGFHERLMTATQDLALRLQFEPLIKQYTEVLEWLDNSTDLTHKAVYKRCVSALAHATALSVQTYHKTAELLLTKQRRSTADEADALTQMTVVLIRHISSISSLFTQKLNSLPSEDTDNTQLNNYITNMFLEAGNSSTYVQNAFQLALPILQIGAV